MALFGRKKISSVEEPATVTRHGASSSHPNFNDLTFGDVSSGVPRIRVGAMLDSFKRQLKWFIPLMLVGVAAAWYLTRDLKRTYHADGTILVQLGPEYVYDPIGSQGTNSAGLSLTPDHIINSEIALMKNSDNISRVISELEAEFGARFAPENYAERARHAEGSRAYKDALVELQTAVDRSFGVGAQPKSSILSVSYKHEDPEIAKKALNLFIDAYLDFRRTIFVEGSGEVITERRIATEEQLKANQRAITRFLSRNGVSDFDSERTGVTKRTEELRETLNTLQADLTENEKALATVENQLRATPQQISLQIDDRASQRVAQAELELQQLLTKYLPTSEPVRRKQAEVDQIRSLQNSYGTTVRGGRRVGPNTVYQELETRRNTLQSTADALREKEITIQRQLNQADAKVKKLQSLSPKYADLIREEATLDERLKDYTAKEQEALINQQQAQANSENVRVIDRAAHARKGRNMKVLMFALITLGWGVTLAMIALMRVFLDPALYLAQQQTRGRRRADRAGDSQPRHSEPQAQPKPDMPQVASLATATENYIPEAVASAPHQPAVWSDDQSGQPVQYGAVPAQAFAGNTAQDIYANPYAQPGSIAYTQAQQSTEPYIGTVPRSPEG